MQTTKSTSIAAGKPDAKTRIRTTRKNGDAIAGRETPGFSEPSHEQIAQLAAQIYIDSGSQPGRDLENWLKAEQLLRKRQTTWQTGSLRADVGRKAEDGREQSLGQNF